MPEQAGSGQRRSSGTLKDMETSSLLGTNLDDAADVIFFSATASARIGQLRTKLYFQTLQMCVWEVICASVPSGCTSKREYKASCRRGLDRDFDCKFPPAGPTSTETQQIN